MSLQTLDDSASQMLLEQMFAMFEESGIAVDKDSFRQDAPPATITLPKWVAQFGQRRKSTRDLWMAIRWEFEQQEPPCIDQQELARLLAIEAEEKASLSHVITLFRTSTKLQGGAA